MTAYLVDCLDANLAWTLGTNVVHQQKQRRTLYLRGLARRTAYGARNLFVKSVLKPNSGG